MRYAIHFGRARSLQLFDGEAEVSGRLRPSRQDTMRSKRSDMFGGRFGRRNSEAED